MKRFFSLTALLLSTSFLLFHSTSFTNAEIKNGTTLSMVSEEYALIAINYEEGRMFEVTNNTENTIRIESRGATNVEGNASSYIIPGRTYGFTIDGESEDLIGIGGYIHLIAQWDGGSAEIQSKIPESNIEQIILELNEDLVAPELNEDLETTELSEEKVTPEPNKEQTASESTKEQTASESTKEQTASESTKEQTASESNKEQTAPESTKEQTAPESTKEQTASESNKEQTASEPNETDSEMLSESNEEK